MEMATNVIIYEENAEVPNVHKVYKRPKLNLDNFPYSLHDEGYECREIIAKRTMDYTEQLDALVGLYYDKKPLALKACIKLLGESTDNSIEFVREKGLINFMDLSVEKLRGNTYLSFDPYTMSIASISLMLFLLIREFGEINLFDKGDSITYMLNNYKYMFDGNYPDAVFTSFGYYSLFSSSFAMGSWNITDCNGISSYMKKALTGWYCKGFFDFCDNFGIDLNRISYPQYTIFSNFAHFREYMENKNK